MQMAFGLESVACAGSNVVHHPVAMRLGILGSGKGSNFGAILRAIQSGDLEATVEIVISDVPGAGILDLASTAGIPTHTLIEPRYKSRLSPEVEEELVRVLQAAKVDLVVLAGYMRVVKAPLLEAFPRRVINIHPSLLPNFRGLEAWRQALEAGVEKTGCTVHYVDSGVDTGEIISQTEVPLIEGDTPESLHARIQAAEHHLYPAVIRQLAKENR
jgi:phosphoribosylglycinamide formyltransferase-1